MISYRSLCRRAAWLLSVCLAVVIGAVGCGGNGQPGPDDEEVTIVIDGSSTVFPISKAAQEAYSAGHPDVTVVVDNHGTGGGFSRYLEGEADIVGASRDARPEEEAQARAQGIPWTRFLVGYDGITLVVNPRNDFVESLSVEQLAKLWRPGSTVTTWKDLDPSWPDRKIVLYSPNDTSGTFEYFTQAIVGTRGDQRDDVQQNFDDNTLVSGVAGDVDGLGYFGHAYYLANASKLRALAVRNGPSAGPVLPTPETVLDKSYAPLSRPLYIFVKRSALRRPGVGAFVKYYLLNIRALSEKGGYVAPSEDDRAANQKAFDAASRTAEAPSGPPAPR